MARIDLDERQLRLAAKGLELYAAAAQYDDDLELALELSLIQLRLLTTAEDSLERDVQARNEEYGFVLNPKEQP